MTISDLTSQEYSETNCSYVKLLSKDTELIKSFEEDFDVILELLKSIPSNKLEYRYAKDKWSLKEVFQHIIDTERIFMHRCFRISRHDVTPLPGFEQDDYILPSQANNKKIESLIDEFKIVRQNSLVLLNSLSETDLKFIGNVNGSNLSARAAAFNTIGHNKWHINIIKERYLNYN